MLVKIALSVFMLGVMVSACMPLSSNRPWAQNCERNYSETAYDLQRCLDRQAKNKKVVPDKPTVQIDPEETDRPGPNAF